STVLVCNDEQFGTRLIAYIVNGEGSCNIQDLRVFLESELPSFMVPSQFVVLQSLDRTPNGKIDKRALMKREPRHQMETERGHVAPRNWIESALTRIWEYVLGIEQISVNDNFFELGGHSLLAVRLFSQIAKVFRQELPLAVLFKAQTPAQL